MHGTFHSAWCLVIFQAFQQEMEQMLQHLGSFQGVLKMNAPPVDETDGKQKKTERGPINVLVPTVAIFHKCNYKHQQQLGSSLGHFT